MLALSQLSRAVEMREDKRPNLADLRESGSIEQDADVVMFVYREEYYLNKREPERKMEESEDAFNLRHDDWMRKMQNSENKAEVVVAKQRHGPIGSVQVHFEKRFTHFTDLTESTHLPQVFKPLCLTNILEMRIAPSRLILTRLSPIGAISMDCLRPQQKPPRW